MTAHNVDPKAVRQGQEAGAPFWPEVHPGILPAQIRSLAKALRRAQVLAYAATRRLYSEVLVRFRQAAAQESLAQCFDSRPEQRPGRAVQPRPQRPWQEQGKWSVVFAFLLKNAGADAILEGLEILLASSPARKVRDPRPIAIAIAHPTQVRKQVNYAESDADSDDDEVFKPVSANGTNKRTLKRRKIAALDDSDGDEYGPDVVEDEDDDGPPRFLPLCSAVKN